MNAECTAHCIEKAYLERSHVCVVAPPKLETCTHVCKHALRIHSQMRAQFVTDIRTHGQCMPSAPRTHAQTSCCSSAASRKKITQEGANHVKQLHHDFGGSQYRAKRCIHKFTNTLLASMRMAASKLWLPHSAAARRLWQLMHRTRILNTQEPDNRQNRVKLLHQIATLLHLRNCTHPQQCATCAIEVIQAHAHYTLAKHAQHSSAFHVFHWLALQLLRMSMATHHHATCYT